MRSGRRYDVWTTDNRLLCQGRPRPFRRRYDVLDGTGAFVLRVRTAAFSARRRRIVLADGRRLHMRDQVWPRQTVLTDDDGTVLVTMERANRRWTSSSVVVRPNGPVGDLGFLAAVVVGDWGEVERPKLDSWS
ncbi:hypothetical protein GCM10027265_24840 [Jatrophihabitans fulvus]